MSRAPVRFSEEQQALFDRVRDLIHSRPHDFISAGHYLESVGDLEGEDVAKLSHYDLITRVANDLLSFPPDYAAAAGIDDARLVLLVAWVLTDNKRGLRTSPPVLTWKWEWRSAPQGPENAEQAAAAPLSFLLVDEQRADVELGWPNRLYARMALLDDRLDEWVGVVRDALRSLGESEQEPVPQVNTRRAVESPADSGQAKRAEDLDQDARMSSKDIADRLDLKPEALRKRLDRFRRDHPDRDEGWQEIANPGPNEPRYIYKIKAIRSILDEMCGASGH